MHKMRRSVKPDAQTRGLPDRRKHGCGRAFAIGAGEMNDGITHVGITPKRAEFFNALKAELPAQEAERVEIVERVFVHLNNPMQQLSAIGNNLHTVVVGRITFLFVTA